MAPTVVTSAIDSRLIGEDVFINLAELMLLHIVDEDDRLNVITLQEVGS